MGEEEARLERQALELFGVALSPRQLEDLTRYVSLVESWASKVNLVSVRSRTELLERHVLDSLAPTRLLGESRRIVDLGSGAGFPGIPLAIVAEPGREFVLIESRCRRATFLRLIAREIGLRGVAVLEGRAEDWRPPLAVDLVLARAVNRDVVEEFGRRVLLPGRRLVLMQKGGELASPAGFMFDVEHRYRLPAGSTHRVSAWTRLPA